MSQPDKVDRLLESYRRIKSLKEEGMGIGALGAGGGQHKIYPGTVEANGQIAGLPPDEPPVDLRKRKHRKLNMFYRQAVKQSRKGAKNGRKRS